MITGLCIIPSCFPQRYHIVKDKKTWTEAQSYCREKYTDLVTINSQEDNNMLSEMLKENNQDDDVWTGLYGEPHWTWSLAKEGFYGKGEAEFRQWNSGEPNSGADFVNCAAIPSYGGGWWDDNCYKSFPFICYNGKR